MRWGDWCNSAARKRVITWCACVLSGGCMLACFAPSAHASTASQTDVMFVFDTSGSMSPVLSEAKAEIQEVMAHLSATLPNVEFGVAESRDYAPSEYDGSSSRPALDP